MLRQSPLKGILRFSKPKTPGFGISKNYYLTVLAAKAPLPSIRDIVSPKGEFDAIPGYGVPLAQGASRDCLEKSIERGAYAMAAPDQKTVLRMMVMSKEEAGFCPHTCVRMAQEMTLDEEAKSRLLSTWSILQLTIESHHPMVYPAVNFLLKVACKIAIATDGLVADPLCHVYRTPGSIGSETNDNRMSAADVVAVHTHPTGELTSLQTMGMVKFLLPEVKICDVDFGYARLAENLLLDISQAMLDGHRFTEGEWIVKPDHGFVLEGSILTDATGREVPCFEVVAPKGKSINDILTTWADGKQAPNEQAPRL